MNISLFSFELLQNSDTKRAPDPDPNPDPDTSTEQDYIDLQPCLTVERPDSLAGGEVLVVIVVLLPLDDHLHLPRLRVRHYHQRALQRNMLRDRRRGTTPCPTCWAMDQSTEITRGPPELVKHFHL
jgi:hypothetical protein